MVVSNCAQGQSCRLNGANEIQLTCDKQCNKHQNRNQANNHKNGSETGMLDQFSHIAC